MYLFKREDAQTSYNNGGFKLEVMAYIITILLRHETSFKLLFWQYSNYLYAQVLFYSTHRNTDLFSRSGKVMEIDAILKVIRFCTE